MPRITPYNGRDTVRVGGKRTDPNPKVENSRWWLLKKDRELAECLFSVVNYLKKQQAWREKQASFFARLYGNMPIWNYLGVNWTKLSTAYRFPDERPTMNVIQSCVDGLVSRMVQSKPKPMFVTSGGDYKKRKLAKDLNKFIDGEFYHCRVYEQMEQVLRDAAVLGDGVLKVYRTEKNRVGLERVLPTEIYVDDQDGMYGDPQQLHQLKLIHRDVLAECYPTKKGAIMSASAAYFDASSESQNTIASQLMVVESWHLPSGPEASDGRHVIAIENATLYDSDDDGGFKEEGYPFVKFPYAPRTVGFWAQGLCEQLMGTQNNINRVLMAIAESLHWSVPRFLVEESSKVASATITNQIASILKYQGIKPELVTWQTVAPELIAMLNQYVQFAYQQSGISQLSASSQKPAGLNSGAALREYDDLQSDRFAYISQRYEKFALDLAEKMFGVAKKINDEQGSYDTVYPGKDSITVVEFPKDLADDDFIIQAYPVSAYSKNPAQRKAQIIEDAQAGIISPDDLRRLLDFPDLQQVTQLLNAPEERILKILDEIIEEGKYTPPDPFMDIQKAKTLCMQYINKYLQENLEEEKAEMLRTFSQQLDMMTAAAMAPVNPPTTPLANPEPTPTSPALPNVAQGVAA